MRLLYCMKVDVLYKWWQKARRCESYQWLNYLLKPIVNFKMLLTINWYPILKFCFAMLCKTIIM